MTDVLMSVMRSISARLLFMLFTTITVIIGAYALWRTYTAEEHWTRLATDNAERTSEMVKAATHYGMLLNRKDAVQHTIDKLSESPGVLGIRVYDKLGTIRFTDKPEELGRQIDPSAEVCEACHVTSEPRRDSPISERVRIFEVDGERVLGLITPIENSASCARSKCHAAPPEETVLGVLDVQLSLAEEDRAKHRENSQILWTALAMMLVMGTGAAIFVLRVVRRPVRALHDGTKQLASDLTYRIPENGLGELGDLARAFNQMAHDLNDAQDELRSWSCELEKKVAEKTETLHKAERQVAQMDKMASLGKLAATVAHELNNPLAGMLTYAKLVDRDLGRMEILEDEVRDELQGYMRLIQKESSRCGNIVRNLLLFARHSGAEMASVNVREVLERCLMLMKHHVEMANTRLVVEISDADDQCICDASQLEQALVALMVNGIEAIKEGEEGVLTVRFDADQDSITIEVEDNGQGIPEVILPHVFEPFFSTKEEVKGVGLGLSVVYGIVQRHCGVIDVVSVVGEGTTFLLHLPRHPDLQTAEVSSELQPSETRPNA